MFDKPLEWYWELSIVFQDVAVLLPELVYLKMMSQNANGQQLSAVSTLEIARRRIVVDDLESATIP